MRVCIKKYTVRVCATDMPLITYSVLMNPQELNEKQETTSVQISFA